jgi:hypothetical protein
MKKNKDVPGAQMTHLASFVPIFIVAAPNHCYCHSLLYT